MADHGIEAAPAYWLHRAYHATRSATLAWWRARGWDGTPEQWVVLARLWEDDDVPVGLLAERTFRDKAGATRLVQQLAQRGLVAVVDDPSDGRVRRVQLTASGRAARQRLVPLVDALRARLLDGLDEAEQAELVRLLRVVLRNAEALASPEEG